MDFERYDNMTIDELEDEKKDLEGALSNENIWCLGARTVAEFNMCASNMDDMKRELKYVVDLIKEKKKNNKSHAVQDVGFRTRPVNIATYRKRKIKMLEKEFKFALTKEERDHINALTTEIAIDMYVRTLFKKYFV